MSWTPESFFSLEHEYHSFLQSWQKALLPGETPGSLPPRDHVFLEGLLWHLQEKQQQLLLKAEYGKESKGCSVKAHLLLQRHCNTRGLTLPPCLPYQGLCLPEDVPSYFHWPQALCRCTLRGSQHA